MIYGMNLDLRTYSTFAIGGIAHKVFEINEKEDIEKINSYSQYVDKPLVFIGEGSNSIFAETTDKYVIGLLKIRGLEILSQEDTTVYIKAYAGEKWDDVVKWSVEHGLSGLEPLSGIPGTAGAAPIQNIGAYGAELSTCFVEAEVFDRVSKKFITLTRDVCEFGYRDSIFKKNREKFCIVSITLKLSIRPAKIPEYKDVQEYFASNSNPQCCHPREGGDPGSQNSHTCHLCVKIKPSTKEVRDAIIEIRKRKIPDYKKIPNCGSFFKNPIIADNHLSKIKKDFPTIPSFVLPENLHKVFAGWLIEHVDYISAQTDSIIFNDTNKLVLLNVGNGSFEDLQTVLTKITKLAQDTYGIELEVEPNIFR